MAKKKKIVAKKIVAKKVTPKKKKSMPKKAAPKKVAPKKVTPKKTPTKKVAPKKIVIKKVAKKAAPIKKIAPVRKTAGKKISARTSDFKTIESRITDELVFAKYETGAHTHYDKGWKDPIITEEPPLAYDMDRVVLLPVDPKFAFSYWEIREDTLHSFRERFGWESKLFLRIYDVTNVEFNGFNANEWWDVEVFNRIGTWYIKHYKGDRNLLMDIGVKDSGGMYHVICRSRAIYFPRDTMVAPGKILWMLVDEFGNKVISDIEDYTDDDLLLLRRILGDERFKRFMRGGLDIFLGGSAWGKMPVVEVFIDLGKLPSSKGGSNFLPSSLEARP
ncbi:MAG: DUF4912 domain-containing protein [Pseudomonadota bacterium]